MLLQALNLGKKYGEFAALAGLDLEIDAGECVALIGHNGSGKTTAVRTLAGYLAPTSGRAEVCGYDTGSASVEARSHLAFVGDSPILYEDLTVGEHLEFVGLAHGVGEGLDRLIDSLLADFGLTARRDALPSQLSRGMRQKTHVACALVRPFSILILDEPVVGLDPPSQRMLKAKLHSLVSDNKGVLFTTHQLAFAKGLAHTVVLLSEGYVLARGPFDEVISSDEAHRLGFV